MAPCLPYLSRLPTLLRMQDTDEQGHTAMDGNEVLTKYMVESMLSPYPTSRGKGLGPKDLQVSGTRSKGTSARYGSELLGEKTGVWSQLVWASGVT